MKRIIFILFFPFIAAAQFAPPAGQPGTTAMYKDSSAFVRWATFCVVTRGLQDISNPSGGYATAGDSSKPLGKADNGIVSLGDGGSAVCTFAYPLVDAPGYDFAVFENSFSDDYLEFGFVEVSSDGINFFRFASTCNIQDTLQTGPFDLSDATKVNNLAGKYRGLYGTPFDLQELQSQAGLDIHNVNYIKIVDVVGSINSAYATYDNSGHKINDPWPTGFPSGGFDFDAIGVIHDAANSVREENNVALLVYPTLLHRSEELIIESERGIDSIEFIASDGINIAREFTRGEKRIKINTTALQPGAYVVKIISGLQCISRKIVLLP